jgi:hypothetical protein
MTLITLLYTYFHSAIHRLYFYTEKWAFIPIFTILSSTISFFINDISTRVIIIIVSLLLSILIKLGMKKMIEILYLAQTKGILYTEVNRKWLIRYDKKNKKFIWEVTIENVIKNVGPFEIKELPYSEVSSQYEQKDVVFNAYQSSNDHDRLEIDNGFERYTNSMFMDENNRIKVYSIRKYLRLKEPLKPKTSSRVVIEVSFTHEKNLFKEEGTIGAYSKYPRLKDYMELEVASPLEISFFKYEILSPLGNSDSVLREITNKPEFDKVSKRKIKWHLSNPMSDFDYHLNFTTKIKEDVK